MEIYAERILASLELYFLSYQGRMNPLFLFSGILIAYFFTRKLYEVGLKAFFFRFFGKDPFLAPSFRVDLALFLLVVFGISDASLFFGDDFFNYVIGRPLRDYLYISESSGRNGIFSDTSSWYPFVLCGYGIFLVFFSELATYVQHRVTHWGALWHFHKIHHSASRLGVLTFKRDHPVDFLSQGIFGLAKKVALLSLNFILFGRIIDPQTLTIYVMMRTIYLSHGILHHSEVWLCFPNWLSHLLVSPAMHQIHHSQNEKHFNKNFSIVISFWDWVFGTLYIPAKDEYRDLKFGIASDDRPDEGSIRDCLIYPFRRIFLENGAHFARKNQKIPS